jgi:hypothetical protein
MSQEIVKFCLFIVTPDSWYPAIQNAPAHSSVCDIVKLEELIQKIRPGFGNNYLTHVTRCNEKSIPLEKEYLTLERYSETLRKRALLKEQTKTL